MKESTKQNKLEFFHKKNSYLFPQHTIIYADGNAVFAEISGQKIYDLNKYIKPKTARPAKHKIGLATTLNASDIYKNYESINEYLNQNKSFDMMTFDYDTTNKLSLCSFFKSKEMDDAENLIKNIKDSFLHLVNVFNHPVTRLKDFDTILPIDAVKRVTNTSLHHFMIHTRYWDNSATGKIKPRSLLTKVYDDDYAIYENIVFKELIDKILWFLLKRTYNLSEALFAIIDSLQVDAFQHTSHTMYYLAIGKLYVSLSKSENFKELNNLLIETKQLYNKLIPYKANKVYVKNAALKINADTINKTNLFTMHKDYKHVYSLYNKLNTRLYKNHRAGNQENQIKSQDYYQEFCKLMLLFSLKHFNFTCDPRAVIYNNKVINVEFKFKLFTAVIKSKRCKALDFDVIEMKIKSNKTIKILLIPFCYQLFNDKKKDYSNIIDRLFDNGERYDKYVFLDPFDIEKDSVHDYHLKSLKKELSYAILPVSIIEFNSFRRIQKIIFEGMVKSQTRQDICPFCGDQLSFRDNKASCKRCLTIIERIECNQCSNSFIGSYADINKNNTTFNDAGYYQNLPQILKDEKENLFRNITEIKSNKYICPHCGNPIKIIN